MIRLGKLAACSNAGIINGNTVVVGMPALLNLDIVNIEVCLTV